MCEKRITRSLIESENRMTAADKPIPVRKNLSTPGAAAPAAPEQPGKPPAEPPTEEARPPLPPLGARTLTDILDYLCRPFHLAHIELKPGAMNGEKTRALVLPYVDSRILQ